MPSGAPARLRVSTRAAPRPRGQPLHRLRGLWRALWLGLAGAPHTALHLAVDDGLGQRVFSHTDTTGVGAHIMLPANLYHVTATMGAVQRRYTVRLTPGADVALRLRLPSAEL